MLNIQLDVNAIRPIVRAAVSEAIEQLEAERAKFTGRLAFTESEAAALLGVKPHVLRDCRLRGELQAAKVGSKNVYTTADLLSFLERQKENN